MINNNLIHPYIMKYRYGLLFLILNVIIAFKIQAQQTLVDNNPHAEYNKAVDLFQKEKYGAAQQSFKNVIKLIQQPKSEMQISAVYYFAVCAAELYHNDAEFLLTSFIQQYPENIKTHFAYFQLAKYLFYKKEHEKSQQWFDKVDVRDLTEGERYEYYFKRGYNFLKTGDERNAKKSFYEVINAQSKYMYPSNYYYGHIAYKEGNYETALQCFEKLTKDENFGPIVPYYITQIYFMQRRYNDVITYAPPLLELSSTKRPHEIAKMLAIAYYETFQYAEALKYFTLYREKTTQAIDKNDFYMIGYANYRLKQYKNSIEAFEKIEQKEDSITQNAYYHLGDCYLHTDQKNFAKNAFFIASKLKFDSLIKEDALFNYAKLSYELSFDPFNEAIGAFTQYINDYPRSPRLDEARNYLVNLYLTTKNFKEALIAIENIKVIDVKLRNAYQKIAYFRGIELFLNNEYAEAIQLFNKSLRFKEDEEVLAKTLYWKGESYYRLNNFDSAAAEYQKFLISTGAFSQPEFYIAHYNLGYALMKQRKFSDAIIAFRKFLTNKDKEKTEIVNDAYLRTADCYFISKLYEDAKDYYQLAFQNKAAEADYALFQKSVTLGVLGRFNEKITALVKLTEDFPTSKYTPNAKFELGNTYMIINDNEKAMLYFNKVMTDYPKSDYARMALLKTGLVHYNKDENDAALLTFKKVITQYPNTTEAKEALLTMRNIYMEKGNVNDFFDYTKTLSFINISETAQDSITYIAAENQFMDGKCNEAIKGFGDYLAKFGNGFFIINANFYKAECELKLKDTANAIKGYEMVLSQSVSKFTESALLKAAYIKYNQKQYVLAIQYFKQLEEQAKLSKNVVEAAYGLMMSYYKNGQYEEANTYSQKLIAMSNVSEPILLESRLIMARIAMQKNDYTAAKSEYAKVIASANSIHAAESQFGMAEIAYLQSNYKESAKLIFELANKYGAYDFWVAKGYILLADNYVKQGNTFQAKHTLNSVINNYEGADLVHIAEEKLKAIEENDAVLQSSSPKSHGNDKSDSLFKDF